MKKEIILTIFISICVYQFYSLYSWVIHERKKYRNMKMPGSNLQQDVLKEDKCIDYPMNTAPTSPYTGVTDTSTFEIVYNAIMLLSLIGLAYLYYN